MGRITRGATRVVITLCAAFLAMWMPAVSFAQEAELPKDDTAALEKRSGDLEVTEAPPEEENPQVEGGADKIDPVVEAAVSGLIKALEDDYRGNVRMAAVQALGKIGPEAKVAVPALIEALDRWGEGYLHRDAAAALFGIGTAVVPALIEALKHERLNVRRHAASALGQFGPEATAGIPELFKALNDDNWEIRSSAAEALGEVGPAAVPALGKALENEYLDVRWSAAEALGRIGPGADPTLIKALKDENADVRRAAAEVLGTILRQTEKQPK